MKDPGFDQEKLDALNRQILASRTEKVERCRLDWVGGDDGPKRMVVMTPDSNGDFFVVTRR